MMRQLNEMMLMSSKLCVGLYISACQMLYQVECLVGSRVDSWQSNHIFLLGTKKRIKRRPEAEQPQALASAHLASFPFLYLFLVLPPCKLACSLNTDAHCAVGDEDEHGPRDDAPIGQRAMEKV